MQLKNAIVGKRQCGGLLIELEYKSPKLAYSIQVNETPLKKCTQCGAQIRTFNTHCRSLVIKKIKE